MHKKWMKMKEPKYKEAYEAPKEEFVMASAVMDVRKRAGLTQEDLAEEDGDVPAGCRAPGKRAHAPIHADAGEAGGSYRRVCSSALSRTMRSDLRNDNHAHERERQNQEADAHAAQKSRGARRSTACRAIKSLRAQWPSSKMPLLTIPWGVSNADWDSYCRLWT
jgi:hypothetical protein